LSLLVVIYAAVLVYALVAWLPLLVENYEKLATNHPNWAYAYLGAIIAGGAVLGVASLVIFWRLWRNTAAKRRSQTRRGRNPSEMSARRQPRRQPRAGR
jgi:hypothetical protein